MPAPKGHAPYEGCQTGGRPRRWTDEVIDEEANALMKWLEEKDGNIILELFCFKRGYTHTQVYDWIKRHEKFHEAYRLYKEKQKGTLMAGGLNKQFGQPTVALMLAANHGMYSKTESNITATINPLSGILSECDGGSKDLVSE